MTLESNEAQQFLNDINRMLVNKGQKVRNYLRDQNRLMMDSLEAGEVDTAKYSFSELIFLYQKLREEEVVDADAITRTLNRANDAHNEEA